MGQNCDNMIVCMIYRLVVEDPSKQDEITSTITQAVEGSSHQRTFGKEVNYSLPFDQSNNFASEFFANFFFQ